MNEIRWKSIQDVPWKLVKLLSSSGQCHFHHHWTPTPADMRLDGADRRAAGSTVSHGRTPHQLHGTSQSRTCFLHQYFSFFWSGGKGSVVDSVQIKQPLTIKQRSTSQGIWCLRKGSCCPLWESDSLINGGKMNPKGARRNSPLACN